MEIYIPMVGGYWTFLKDIQWLWGMLSAFYFYKALQGELRDGDGWRLGAVSLLWFVIVAATPG